MTHGMNWMRMGWFWIALIGSLSTWAQGASVELSVDRSTVMRGESVQLTFTFNNCDANLSVPEITGLKYAYGPAKGNNISIVNGRRSSQTIYTYTYVVTAENDVPIPAYTVNTNNGKFQTEGFTIRVKKSSGTTSNQGAAAVLEREVAMVIDVSKRNVVVGEPVVATLQIYSQMSGLDVREYSIPEFTGFWKEAVDLPNPSFEPRLLNGRRIQVATVGKFVLFPQQTGELIIDGFDLQGYVRTSFFNGRNVAAAADPVTIRVSPLPAPVPADHLGAFKRLDVELKASELEVEANQAFTVDIAFKGNGNLKFLREPQWEWPRDFEVFDPEVKDRISIEDAGEVGSRTFHYVVIPRTTGTFTIPELRVSWYDATRGEHVERTLGGESLTVSAGNGTPSATLSYNSKSDIQILNQDIRYIQLEADRFVPLSGGGWMKVGLASGLALGPLQWLLLWAYQRRKAAEARDIKGTRKRQAKSRIRKELREAQKSIHDPATFYMALGHGLESYLIAKLGWSQSEYTCNGALTALGQAAPSTQAEWKSLLEAVDLARYAPGAFGAPQSLYDQAENLVNRTEKEWKS
jgi:hypothetical protein